MASSGEAYERPTQPGTTQRGSGSERNLVDKAWDVQHRMEQRTKRIGSGRYARVLKMARKPEPEEFQRSAKITAIGLLVVGLIGFIIFLLMDILAGALGIQ